MNRRCWIIAIALVSFLSLSNLVLHPAVTQTRQYHLGREWVKIWINSDGSIDLFYNISITLDSGSDIHFINVGQPQGDFVIANATDQYGNLLSTSDASSRSDYKVQVNLASPLTAGQTIWFTVTTNVARMIYKDNETNVGILFTPTWWPEATVNDLRVSIVLPAGVAQNQIATSVNWDNLSLDGEHRMVFWERTNLPPNQQYTFGVSFPKEYVQIYVGRDSVHNLNTGLDYDTIQEAIDANETMNRHTILVEAGSYDERITISKSISLIGKNKTDTVINTKEYFWGTAVNVTSSDVEIANFSFPSAFLTKIWVGSCSNVTISNNVIESARQCIVLNGSQHCSIIGNDLGGFGLEENDLILLLGADECVIEDNSVLNACYDGIGLYSSSNNVICNNIISQNQYGIEFRGASTGNSIFHNNFVSNHPFQVISINGSNVWDNGLEGNYWSDYNGTDNNQDGIGDTPYVIDEYNVDHHPLMGILYGPWVRGSGQVDIVSNSTVSNFWFTLDALWGVGTVLHDVSFDVSGESGTIGFCRVHLSYALFNGTYSVLVNGTQVPYALLPCSNDTDSYLYFTYAHSTEKVEIIPESPSISILTFFLITTLLVVGLTRAVGLESLRSYRARVRVRGLARSLGSIEKSVAVFCVWTAAASAVLEWVWVFSVDVLKVEGCCYFFDVIAQARN